MIILQVHNKYRESGGEDVVIEQERRLLQENGHTVIQWIKDNSSIDNWSIIQKVETALFSAWSPRSYLEAKRLLKKTKPDVVHVHNTVPQVTLSVYSACSILKIPVVQTLHNYRFLAPCATLNRKGKVCELCINKKFPYPSIFYRCYRGSIIQSMIMSINKFIAATTKINSKKVTMYIALTNYAASNFVKAGFDKEKIIVKPNFTEQTPTLGKHKGQYALYVGRLSMEKGVETMLNAWKSIGNKLPLKVVGMGPLMKEIEKSGIQAVSVLGWRERKEVFELMKNATVLVFPSECYEGFPMVLVEAFMAGLPVIATNIGSQNEIVQEGHNGFKFKAGDADNLIEKVNQFLLLIQSDISIYKETYDIGCENYSRKKNLSVMLDCYKRIVYQSVNSRG